MALANPILGEASSGQYIEPRDNTTVPIVFKSHSIGIHIKYSCPYNNLDETLLIYMQPDDLCSPKINLGHYFL